MQAVELKRVGREIVQLALAIIVLKVRPLRVSGPY